MLLYKRKMIIFAFFGFFLQTCFAFNIMEYGAVGNGQTDDSHAFEKGWKDVCGIAGDVVTLQVPQKTFLLNPLILYGPCKAKTIHIQLVGTLVAPQSTTWATGTVYFWIEFSDVDNLILDGGGKIDGQGSLWWQPCKKTSNFGKLFDCKQRPGALRFTNCNGLQLKALNHLNSPRSHVSIFRCSKVIISNLHIIAPKDSPNTDGIDIADSKNIQIQDSTIGTGDDCVAINGGSSFINITGVNCGPDHGISIGSLGDGGAYDTVEEVHVKNCNFSNTENGVRIKTIKGASGFARKISFEHISFNNCQNPIIINQFYEDKGKSGSQEQGKAIKLSDVIYSDLHGTSASTQAIYLDCDNVVGGCSNIVMNNIQIKSASGQQIEAFCNNAHGTATKTQPLISCLSQK